MLKFNKETRKAFGELISKFSDTQELIKVLFASFWNNISLKNYRGENFSEMASFPPKSCQNVQWPDNKLYEKVKGFFSEWELSCALHPQEDNTIYVKLKPFQNGSYGELFFKFVYADSITEDAEPIDIELAWQSLAVTYHRKIQFDELNKIKEPKDFDTFIGNYGFFELMSNNAFKRNSKMNFLLEILSMLFKDPLADKIKEPEEKWAKNAITIIGDICKYILANISNKDVEIEDPLKGSEKGYYSLQLGDEHKILKDWTLMNIHKVDVENGESTREYVLYPGGLFDAKSFSISLIKDNHTNQWSIWINAIDKDGKLKCSQVNIANKTMRVLFIQMITDAKMRASGELEIWK